MAIAFNSPWIPRRKSASSNTDDPPSAAPTLVPRLCPSVDPEGSLRMVWATGPDGRLVCRWVSPETQLPAAAHLVLLPDPDPAPDRVKSGGARERGHHLRLVVLDPDVV
jgi:hypothetical protein